MKIVTEFVPEVGDVVKFARGSGVIESFFDDCDGRHKWAYVLLTAYVSTTGKSAFERYECPTVSCLRWHPDESAWKPIDSPNPS
jgi:hypothetical protein